MAEQSITDDFQIRMLAVSEWAQYRQLRLRALQTDAPAFTTTHSDMLAMDDAYWQSRLRDAQRGETNWLLFAERRGELIGMVGAFRARLPGEAELVSMYVASDARGYGVAHKLVTELLNILQGAGIQTAYLSAGASQSAALATYRSCGFTEIARDAQVIRMKRALTDSGQRPITSG